MKPYYVYILRTDKNTLYTGIALDPGRRLEEHRNKKSGARYTKAFIPEEIVYLESQPDRSNALKREIEIKKMSRKEKDHLILTKVN